MALAERRARLNAEGTNKFAATGQVMRQAGGRSAPIKTTIVEDRKSNIEKFAEWGTNVGKTALNVAGAVGKATGKFVANSAVDAYQGATRAAKSVTGIDQAVLTAKNSQIAKASKDIDRIQANITENYKSGKMNKEDYAKALQEMAKIQGELSKESSKVAVQADPVGRAMDVVETGTTLLSVGSLKLAQVGGKEAAKVGVKEAIDVGATNLEKQILKNKAVRSLVERNLQSAAKIATSETTEQLVYRQGKQIAAGLLIKRPLFYQSNINDATSALEGILTGNYPQALKSSAWIGLNMLNGGPIGYFLEKGRLAGTALKKLSYGKDSFIDATSRRIGSGNSRQIFNYLEDLKKNDPKEYTKAVQAFRIAQEMNLRASSDDVELAAENFLRTDVESGANLATLTPEKILKHLNNWVQADQTWKKAVRQGIIPGMDKVEAARYTPVRWDAATRTSVAETVKNASEMTPKRYIQKFSSGQPDLSVRGAELEMASMRRAGANYSDTPLYDQEAALEAIMKMADQPGNGWGNNPNLLAQLENIIKTSKSSNEAASRIRAINAASKLPAFIPKKVRDELARLGYTIAEPVGGRKVSSLDLEDTRKLVTGAIKGETDDFTETIIPNPGLASFAQFLEKTGMSPQSSNQVASKVLSENVIANLDNTTAAAIGLNTKGNVPKGGQQILQTLQQYLENKKGILGLGKASASDIRQLYYKEIIEALPGLNLNRTQAKELSKAIKQAYLEVPLEFRGAGDKIVDALYRYNPAHKLYSRMQGAFRYSYNPFFRVQERTETKILSHASAHNLIWNKGKAELDDAARKLDEARIFSSSLYGEGAQDQVLGRITANITQGQKRDLAGLAMDIAEKKGITLDDLINNHSDEIDDALRVIVQYPRKGMLASPLARTMNLAFFPMRYNTKVTLLAAKILSEEPAYIQKAVLHSMFKMGDWLKSEEGIRWQNQHQDAIRLFNWITPVNSIAYVHNLLTNKPDQASDFGMLGGLPLGVISQILDSQGIISLNNPYMDKKTGDVFPKYIPQTTKARAATALTDLLGSTFTYPGRTLGLPGKGEGMRTAVKAFIETNGTDFEKRLDEAQLTDLDRKWIKVVKDMQKGEVNQDEIDALYNSPAPGQYNWYTLPPMTLPFKSEVEKRTVERRTNLPTKAQMKSAKGKKPKKIAQPIQ